VRCWAAIWHRPGGDRSAVAHYLPQAWRFVRALGPWGLGRALRVARASAAHRPAGEHWYLQAVGVHPEARGLGVGTALLGHRLAAVDVAGAAAYLESSTRASTALYRRLGFVALGRVGGFPAPGSPTAMWRPAVTSARGPLAAGA
jgi:ribosomal protein S18 acetylase RimI-like enzyme